MKIYKYKIDIFKSPLSVPIGWHPVSAGMQGEDFVVWAIVDPTQQLVKKRVAIIGTGWDIDESMTDMAFLNTIQKDGFVWHVFAEI